jgi:hypothetical protein
MSRRRRLFIFLRSSLKKIKTTSPADEGRLVTCTEDDTSSPTVEMRKVSGDDTEIKVNSAEDESIQYCIMRPTGVINDVFGRPYVKTVLR